VNTETQIAEAEYSLPWDTEQFKLAVAAHPGGIAVRTSSVSIGFPNNDDETIEIPWSEILKHVPPDLLIEAVARGAP
jgi:hypothetical protein